MKTFDNLLKPKPQEKKPDPKPATGNKSENVDAMLASYRAPDSPYQTTDFRGIILYKTMITYEEFEKKYNNVFVEFCMGWKKKKASKAPQPKKTKIIEAIIYVPEICSCLPQPEDSDDYFKLMSDINKNRALATTRLSAVADQFKKQANDEQDAKLDKIIKQISRFPKAYYIQSEGSDTTEPTLASSIKVKFPYNYDFSYGLITSVDKR